MLTGPHFDSGHVFSSPLLLLNLEILSFIPAHQKHLAGLTSTVIMPSTPGISLHISVHVAPENADKFLAALKPVIDSVSAEPECTFFEVYQDPEDPGKLSWVENW